MRISTPKSKKHAFQSYYENCCKEGKIKEISELLQSNPEMLNYRDQHLGLTLLANSIKCGQIELSKFLLGKGADPNIGNIISETPLHIAIDNSDLELAEMLLQYKAEPNCMTVDGETPLHHSAFIGDKKMMGLLLSYGADPNIKDTTLGRTPLHCAVQCEHLECVQLLLSYGAIGTIEDKEGNSPISACENGEIFKILEDTRDKTLKNPLHCIPEAHSSDEERNSCRYSFSQSSVSVDFSITESSFVSLSYEVMPTQKFGSEDTTVSIQISQSEDLKLVKFLRGIKMLNYKDLLICEGFDDMDMMIFQMTSIMPITHEVLEEVGIAKHGHRARLLMKLEQIAGVQDHNKPQNKVNKSIIDSGWECCQPKHTFTPGISNLRDWLILLKLDKYQKLFEQAGYEDLQFMVSLMNSRYPIDDNLLKKIGISKLGHRMRVLAKLIEDARNIKLRSATGKEACNLL
ncbi:hypothetical protein SteCoe_29619 [Stentor coeruleus]|uniref:SAM domain-containing protein n=1 Tax=Stentor coeruleus TaxID=5963 RepID=A0A1R2B5T8_9CILI|nr:hypothetical protein SteCoe_29619 [Stentor coeruleus]